MYHGRMHQCDYRLHRAVDMIFADSHMENWSTERWFELCDRAKKEQDPAKLLALVQEINRLLDEKEKQFKSSRKSA